MATAVARRTLPLGELRTPVVLTGQNLPVHIMDQLILIFQSVVEKLATSLGVNPFTSAWT